MESFVLIDYLNDSINELKKIYPEAEVLKSITMDIADYKELLREYKKSDELREKENEYRDLVLELKDYEESSEFGYFRNFYSEEELHKACELIKEKIKKYKS